MVVRLDSIMAVLCCFVLVKRHFEAIYHAWLHRSSQSEGKAVAPPNILYPIEVKPENRGVSRGPLGPRPPPPAESVYNKFLCEKLINFL